MPSYEIDGVAPVVDPSSFVHPTAVLIGDVAIGPRCYIGPGASLRGDFGRVVVGAGSNVQDNCVVHAFPEALADLQDGAHVGHGAVLHGCSLGPNVLVGINAVVMDGAEIGEDSLVAACSFVSAGKSFPGRSLIAGTPARLVRKLDSGTLAWKRNGLRVYQELARRSLTSMREVEPLVADTPQRRRLPVQKDLATPLHELRRQR